MIAYLDMPSGISGDIFLGCLVDGGWPLYDLQAIPAALGLPADTCRISGGDVMRGAMRATHVAVDAEVGDAHRHLGDIETMIQQSTLSERVQDRAIAVFRRLARAEAKVHGTSVEQVHFHEVGAVDAIVDIVGVCAGLDALEIDTLHASPLPLGPGWTQSAHARIPLPAPATLELLAEAGAPTQPAPGRGELVTPTGAALVCELAEFGQPAIGLRRIAVGAGSKEFDWPNVAWLWLGDATTEVRPGGALVVLETNIDDMSAELFPAAYEALMTAGALDVWTTSALMKKGRPATVLSVLAPADVEASIADALLRETTTLGVRVHTVQRYEAEREYASVRTEYGPITVKIKRVHGELLGVKPEYEECARLAQEKGVPVRLVIEGAQTAANLEYGPGPTSSDMTGIGGKLTT